MNDGTYDNGRESNYRGKISNIISQSYGGSGYSDVGESFGAGSTIGDKTIKLNYSINAEFAIR